MDAKFQPNLKNFKMLPFLTPNSLPSIPFFGVYGKGMEGSLVKGFSLSFQLLLNTPRGISLARKTYEISIETVGFQRISQEFLIKQ